MSFAVVGSCWWETGLNTASSGLDASPVYGMEILLSCTDGGVTEQPLQCSKIAAT